MRNNLFPPNGGNPPSSSYGRVLPQGKQSPRLKRQAASRGHSVNNVPTVAPCGTWKSPISAEMIVQGAIVVEAVALDESRLSWIEARPSEGGRRAFMEEQSGATTRERLPIGYDVATRVHEYGGGAFVLDGGILYFSHGGDNRLYRHGLGKEPDPLTAEDFSVRYADLVLDRQRSRLLAVRERRDHHAVENTLVAIPLDDPTTIGEVLASGSDFYMFPRMSPDGSKMAWVQWNHPHMPWDASVLMTADILADGSIGPAATVAGGPDESIFQPEWSPDNQLYFVSDRTGWWNIYRWNQRDVRPITALHAEFGEPAWSFGLSTYGFVSKEEILATYSLSGFSRLALIDVSTREMTHLACPFSTLSHLKVLGSRAIMIAGADRSPRAVVTYDATTKRFRIVRPSSQVMLNEDSISLPEPIEFPNSDSSMSYGFYYAPKNRDYIQPEGERPPLLVTVHDGPASCAKPQFRLDIQYWTTRGFAVVEVNYGGSTGYGRKFRNRLHGRWGIVDVDDVLEAAHFLTRYGKADPNRLLIRGGSAGGYTALAALAFRDAFRAGACYYGISDLAQMARRTHKFESHYLDSLIGPPDNPSLYRERSPLYHAESMTAPVIFFHGDEDRVVPPEQTSLLADALKSAGSPVARLTFLGEGHGLASPTAVIRCHEAELFLYAKVLSIRLPERIEPVSIDNWPTPVRHR